MRTITLFLACGLLLFAMSTAVLATTALGTSFAVGNTTLTPVWSASWLSLFDLATVDGAFGTDHGWLGVGFFGSPPTNPSAPFGDTHAYSVTLKMSGAGWNRMTETDYIKYSIDGGATWTTAGTLVQNSYSVQTITDTISIPATASSVDVLYGVKDVGDWTSTLAGGATAIYAVSATSTAVPEPGSLVAFATGLFGCMGMVIRRRK